MYRQQSQENQFEQMDDHDQPTEPMSRVILSPFSSPTYMAESSIDQQDVPAPQLDERPFPKQSANAADPLHRLPGTPPVYPVLPPAPAASRNGRPAGGSPPNTQPRKPAKPAPRQPRRSSFPVFVGFFFVIVQLLLLLRLVFLLFGVSNNNPWIGLVYIISAVFALPFRLLLGNVKIPVIYGTELYGDLIIIFALLMYGLISRILVRFLKALLHSR